MEPETDSPIHTSQTTSATTSGDSSPAYAAGQDLYLIERQEVFTEPDFEPLNAEDFLPPRFPESDTVPGLLGRFRETHLLLIGRADSDDLEDKRTFARHLAACHQRESNLPIQEWISDQAPGAQRLDYHVRQAEEPTIFLLHHLQPVDVDHDLSLLGAAAQDGDHFVIATTHSVSQVWTHTDSLTWCGLSHSKAYSADYLENLLRRELLDEQNQWPSSLRTCLERNELVPGLSLREVATRIRHPLRLIHFVKSLQRTSLPEIPTEIEERLEALDGSRNALRKWFLRLDQDEQVLVLGLALFHGLFDDQMFAALERLIETTWRQRDPQQKTYDYTDLLQAGAYFRLEGMHRRPTFRVEASSEHLEEIFQLAWDFHRRRLMSSLPALAEIVKEAVRDRPQLRSATDLDSEESRQPEASLEEAARATRWYRSQTGVELFGSPLRNRQIRAAVSTALGRIGELSIEAVQVVLRDLGTDGYRDTQDLVAQTLSRWRESDRESLEPRLFEILHDWERAQVRKTLGVTDQDKEHLGTTVALTLGHAARFDDPDQLHPRLLDLLIKLADRTDADVRRALRDPVIPRIVFWHPRQLAGVVEEGLAAHHDLRVPLARGYAEAHGAHPHRIEELLDGWKKRVLYRELPEATRQGVGVIVARTLGFLRPPTGRRSWTLEEIHQRLEMLLSQEGEREIRHAAWAAAFSQHRHRLAQGAAPLQSLVDATSRLADRPYLMRLLTRLYLDDRHQAGPGETAITVDHKNYEIWYTGEIPRPLTPTEICLYRWLLDGSRPVSQQIALEAFAHFTRTPVDTEESGHRRRWLQATGHYPTPAPSRRDRPTTGMQGRRHDLMDQHPLPRAAGWALHWTTFGREEMRRQAHSPLAQWIHLKPFGDMTEDITARWEQTSMDGLEDLHQTILKAYKLYDLRQVLGWLGFVLFLFLLFGLMYL